MNQVKLENAKPCPFCGSDWIIIGERYYAMCVDCGATGPEKTKTKFLKDWNNRIEVVTSGFTNNKDGSVTNNKTGQTMFGKRIEMGGEVVWEEK